MVYILLLGELFPVCESDFIGNLPGNSAVAQPLTPRCVSSAKFTAKMTVLPGKSRGSERLLDVVASV